MHFLVTLDFFLLYNHVCLKLHIAPHVWAKQKVFVPLWDTLWISLEYIMDF
jgi:hypothetical protein